MSDPADMVALIEPHVPALRRFAWSLLRDDADADDLVQDCLERAVHGWHRRRPEGEIKAWLLAILHGLHLARRRAPHDAQPTDTELPSAEAEGEGSASSVVEHRLVLRDVAALLAALPEDQRVVLLLVGVEDLSYEEVARLVGAPVGTVMSRLSRGRARLRRLLEDGGAEKSAAVMRGVE